MDNQVIKVSEAGQNVLYFIPLGNLHCWLSDRKDIQPAKNLQQQCQRFSLGGDQD